MQTPISAPQAQQTACAAATRLSPAVRARARRPLWLPALIALAILALAGPPAAPVAATPPLSSAHDPVRQYLLVVGGILSTGASTVEGFQPIVGALGARYGRGAEARVSYFSYRGQSAPCERPAIFCPPAYDALDTRKPVELNYPLLHARLREIVEHEPEAIVDIAAYSLGGVVTFGWLGTPAALEGLPEDLAPHIGAVVVLDSPLQGLSQFGNWRDWKSSVASNSIIFGPAAVAFVPDSPTMEAVRRGVLKTGAGAFAVENSADPLVNGVMLQGADGLAGLKGYCSRYLGAVDRAELRDDPVNGTLRVHNIVLRHADAVEQVIAYLDTRPGPCGDPPG